ncbi:MAG TPA: NAD(P)-dependent alcohol dehydrogenase [Candidatus Omnitrophota bacterium]|nr:NAD(P)-dependent alcohol dehydrogenase [Candidatus Omnitrophota bacterium]
MYPTKAYAAESAVKPLGPFEFNRRAVGPNDILIDIHFCGICHSDIHQVRDEWGHSLYPMVPGHEIVGIIAQVGAQVKKFKPGDRVGVGCLVESCRECPECKEGYEQYCPQPVFTYNCKEKDGKTLTQGGYSTRIVVNEDFVLRLPENLPMNATAPLLCAGITTYSPLRHWKAGPGKKVGVIGLGGLGHMAVKIAKAMGAEVSVLSRSRKKETDAKRLGADHYCATAEAGTFEKLAKTFDLIICTVSVDVDWNQYLNTLKRDGTMVVVGVPPKSPTVNAANLIFGRHSLAGSLIGGIRETQEMLDFCGKHNIVSDIEMIPIQKVNEAYERVIKGDVKFRFVIDIASLK